MSRLTILAGTSVKQIETRDHETILAALLRAGITVSAPCGGQGRCGKCQVKLTESGRTQTVLACTTSVTGDCTVEVSAASQGGSITQDGGRDMEQEKTSQSFPHSASKQQVQTVTDSDNQCRAYGIAADLGTTTIVVQLYSLSAPSVRLGSKAAWNEQMSYGADVISRAQYCMTHEDGLQSLALVIRRQIFSLANEICKEQDIPVSAITEAVIAGNTIMQHIFAGLDPSSIATAPYQPLTLFMDMDPMHYPECPQASVTFLPCVAGYIGGDITAGLLSGKLMDERDLCLFLDIGTNGEMALWNGSDFYCCSVASGPAFEGAEITCGMSSIPGAVSHVSYQDDTFHLQVIGDIPPKGICGSGLIDLLSVLLELEIVDETGRLLPPEEADEDFCRYLSEDENGNGIFHLTDTVIITAGDVRKLQLAKAAVAAGIEILLDEADHAPSDVQTLFLAGGFGDNLDIESAVKIGMIPAELTHVTCLGNSSLDGVRQLLLDRRNEETLMEIQKKCRYIELSGSTAFSDAFIDHMSFEEDE